MARPRINPERPLTNAEHQARWRRRHAGALPSKSKRHFIGIDGEGRRGADGRDDYWCLQSSNGALLQTSEGYLRTWDTLPWLFEQVRRPGGIIAGYGLTYDMQHVLRDLSDADWVAAQRRGKPGRFTHLGVRVQPPSDPCAYWIWYVPGKFLEITRQGPSGAAEVLRINDILAWYQMAFTLTLGAAGIGTAAELAECQRMKDLRGAFASIPPAEILAYNEDEVRNCAALATQTDQAIYDATGLRLRSMHGPACLAKGLIRLHVGAVGNAYLDQPEGALEAIDCAFSGGMITVAQLGHFDGVTGYDINSAYPAACLALPCPMGRFVARPPRFDPDITHGLLDVSWDLRGRKNPHYPLTPSWYRTEDGRIHRPPYGRGWRHAAEVAAMVDLWGTDVVAVHGVWGYLPDDPVCPFEWVRAVYAERRRLNDVAPFRGQMLKLGLNSIYGVMCQRLQHDMPPPANRNLFLAGEITARTRARLMRQIALAPRRWIDCNTDGAHFTAGALSAPTGDGIGEWSRTTLARYRVYQPGVHFHQGLDGIWDVRSRGVGRGPALAHREAIERCWEEAGIHGCVAIPCGDQFTRRSSCIARGHGEEAGYWVKREKTICLRPSAGFLRTSGAGSFWRSFEQRRDYTRPSAPYRYGTTEDERWRALRETVREPIVC